MEEGGHRQLQKRRNVFVLIFDISKENKCADEIRQSYNVREKILSELLVSIIFIMNNITSIKYCLSSPTKIGNSQFYKETGLERCMDTVQGLVNYLDLIYQLRAQGLLGSHSQQQ